MIEADDVVKELGMIGFFNFKDLFDELGQLIPIQDMTDVCGHVIASITETVDTQLNVKTTVKLHNKMDALKLIAHHIGMLVERKEISGPDKGPIEVAYSNSSDKFLSFPLFVLIVFTNIFI